MNSQILICLIKWINNRNNVAIQPNKTQTYNKKH